MEDMEQNETASAYSDDSSSDQPRRRKRSADWLGFTSYTTKKPRSVDTYSVTTRKPRPSYFRSSYTTQTARPSYSSFTTKNPRPSSTNTHSYSSYTKQNTAKSTSATVNRETPVVYRRPAAQFYGYQPYQPYTKQVYTTQIPDTTTTKPVARYKENESEVAQTLDEP